MRNYTTQMDAARKHIITPELQIVARKENIEEEQLRKYVAEGKVVICANKNHTSINPEGVGSMSDGRTGTVRRIDEKSMGA